MNASNHFWDFSLWWWVAILIACQWRCTDCRASFSMMSLISSTWGPVVRRLGIPMVWCLVSMIRHEPHPLPWRGLGLGSWCVVVIASLGVGLFFGSADATQCVAPVVECRAQPHILREKTLTPVRCPKIIHFPRGVGRRCPPTVTFASNNEHSGLDDHHGWVVHPFIMLSPCRRRAYTHSSTLGLLSRLGEWVM